MNPKDLWNGLLAGDRGERPLLDLGSTSVSGPWLDEPRRGSLSDFVRLGFRRDPRTVAGPRTTLPRYLDEHARHAARAGGHGRPLEHATERQVRHLPVPGWDLEVDAPGENARSRHLLVAVDPPCPGLLDLCMAMRGTWRFLDDLAGEALIVEALLDWSLQTLTAAYDRLLAGRRPDLVVYGDDLGYGDGAFVSPGEFHLLLAPRMEALFAHIRAASPATILFHTCGNVGPLLPGVLELGVEALNVEPGLLGGLESLRRALPADVILHGVTPLGGLGAALTRGDCADVRRIVHEIAAAHPVIVAEPGSGALEARADPVRAAAYLKGLAWVDRARAAPLTLSAGSGSAP
jgi:hypothetical protein